MDGSVDPLRDVETINLELIFSDYELVEKALDKVRKNAKGNKDLLADVALLEKVLEVLGQGKSARILDLNDEEKKLLRSYQLLSMKPIIYVANVSEDDAADDGANNPYVAKLREFAEAEQAKVVVISAAIEAEISTLEDDEKAEYLEMIGLEQSGLDKLVVASYDLLGLMSFITTGEIETRAWTIKKNTRAVDAAGKIHTDISRGFIRAEIISYDDLVANDGSMVKAREKGQVRLEGKEYLMQDGDVVHFRFNV